LTSAVEIAKEDKAVEWLLDNKSPAIRYWTLKDILGQQEMEYEVVQAREQIASWTPVAEYLNEQHSDGYWGSGEDVYWPKWTATVWPLILLAEIGVPGTNPSIRKGCEYFLKIMDAQDRSWPAPKYPDEDLRGWRAVWEPCITGNMARTLAAFGYSNDRRVREMFEWLIKYQRDDGGWNCETEDYRNGETGFLDARQAEMAKGWARSCRARCRVHVDPSALQERQDREDYPARVDPAPLSNVLLLRYSARVENLVQTGLWRG